MKEVGVEPNLHIYNMLITHFGLMKDPHTVKEVLVKMRDKGTMRGVGGNKGE